MWHDLLPAVSAATLCSLILSVVYFSLWLQRRDLYLLIWSGCWGLYSFRFIFRLVSLTEPAGFFSFNIAQTISIISSLLLVTGAILFCQHKVPRWLWGVASIPIVWVWFGALFTSSIPGRLAPAYIMIGVLYISVAVIALQKRGYSNINRYLIFFALLFWGLHKLDYPFFFNHIWFAPWGYVLGSVFAFVVGVGFLLCVLEVDALLLRDQRRQLLLTFNSTLSGTWQWNVTTGRVDFRDSLSRLLGLDGKSVVNDISFFRELIHPEDELDVWTEFEKILRGEQSGFERRLRLRCQLGQWRMFLLRTSSTGQFDDTLDTKILVIMIDISQYDKILQEKDYLREIYLKLFDNMYTGICFYKPVDGDDFVLLDMNESGAQLLGIDLSQSKGKLLRQCTPELADNQLCEIMKDVSIRGEPRSLSLQIKTAAGKMLWLDNRIFRFDDGSLGVLFEDNTRSHSQQVWQELTVSALGVLNDQENDRECIRSILELIRQYLGIDAVGLRLKDGNDFPYYESRGFSRDFIEKENSLLCAESENSESCMECLCGAVIRGDFDRVLSCFTENGSFWTNNAQEFIQEDLKQLTVFKTRNVCLLKGYLSIALIPLRYGDNTVGLLQLNVRKVDFFSLEMMGFLEKLAASIAIAVRRIQDASALRESEECFRNIYEHAPLGILLINPTDYTIISVNDAFSRITGLSSGKIRGEPFLEFIEDEYVPKVQNMLLECLEVGKVAAGVEYRIKSDERCPLISSMATSQTNSSGTQQSILLMCHDISNERKLQKQLVLSSKMDAISQLAVGVAHDFNNQLAGIMGFADIIAGKSKDEQIRNYAASIVKAAQNSAGLTQQLLNYSSQRGGVMQVVNLHNSIKFVLELLGSNDRVNLEISTSLQAQNNCIKGDPAQLQSLLLNVITNAIEAMPEGGKLQVDTSDVIVGTGEITDLSSGEYIRIRISDTGCGIDENIRDEIFDPFFTTKSAGTGAGMGLASACGVVAAHAGVIRLEPAFGQGTTFAIYLPCMQDKNVYFPQLKLNQSSIVKQGALVMVVDDEPVLRSLISSFLDEMGHQVILCSNGVEALNVYQNAWQEIDLIILDMIMPVMDGEQTFGEIREINPQAKIILTSGYSREGTAQDLLESGACGYIQKPFESAEFRETVSAVLVQ